MYFYINLNLLLLVFFQFLCSSTAADNAKCKIENVPFTFLCWEYKLKEFKISVINLGVKEFNLKTSVINLGVKTFLAVTGL